MHRLKQHSSGLNSAKGAQPLKSVSNGNSFGEPELDGSEVKSKGKGGALSPSGRQSRRTATKEVAVDVPSEDEWSDLVNVTDPLGACERLLGRKANCPLLYSKRPPGCTKDPRALPDWCIKPMQSIDGDKLFRLAKQRNTHLGDTSALAGAKLAAVMGNADFPKMRSLSHFTINRKNDFVLSKIGLRKDILPFKDLPADSRYNFTSCAVVGSSGSLRRHNYGKLIDQFSTVFRFNRAPTIGYEDFVGSKTTFRIQNPERQGFMERQGEICLIKGWARLQETIRKCPSIAFSPQFNEYTRHYWAMHSPEVPSPSDSQDALQSTGIKSTGQPRHKMSTGFQGILLAMHLCQRVAVFGIRQGTDYYYDKKATADHKSWSKRHPWSHEFRCLQQLSASLPSLALF
eukprot:scaffold7243_cov394-Prasinococcus_capsulatus_cf.AAC.8